MLSGKSKVKRSFDEGKKELRGVKNVNIYDTILQERMQILFCCPLQLRIVVINMNSILLAYFIFQLS